MIGQDLQIHIILKSALSPRELFRPPEVKVLAIFTQICVCVYIYIYIYMIQTNIYIYIYIRIIQLYDVSGQDLPGRLRRRHAPEDGRGAR